MAKHDTEIVSTFRARLAEKLGPRRYELWFGSNTHLSLRDDALEIRVPNQFFHDWLRSNFRHEMEATCREVHGRDIPLVFCIEESPVDAPTLPPASPGANTNGTEFPVRAAEHAQRRNATAPPSRPASRRKFARLNTFVAGDSNRLALTSAELVTRKLGSLSPLVLHGPTGVGKTHLMEGIYSAVRKNQPLAQAVYLSAEQFTSYFLEALRGSGLPSFRRKYRGVQLLLIDDIHFFAGKRATLVELLHTIDTLTRDGYQLVMSCDRPPGDLEALGAELTTRLQGGMVCGMEPPQRGVRLGIVRHMASDRKMTVPADVEEFLADSFTSHARELAGALNLLHAASLARGGPIDRAMAEETLAATIRRGAPMVRLADIEKAVCETFGLEGDSLQTPGRLKRLSHPRMLAMWLARKHTRAGLSEIGRHFGRRSHTTVISAQKKVEGWMHDHAAIDLADRRWPVEEAVRRVEQMLRSG